MLYSALFLLLGGSTFAQSPMTLETAIRKALENNHQIRIQKIEVEKRTKQVDASLVGKKPTINLNASYEFGWSDANIETLNFGPGGEGNSELELDGISNDIIISPEINLLLLDGGASNYRLEQLGTVNNIAQIQLKQRIEQTMAEVTSAYLEVNRQQSLLEIARKNIAFTQNRLERIATSSRYGTSGSLQKLQVEVDLKTDSAQLRNLNLQFENAQRNLNYLLGRDSEESFQVMDNFPIEKNLELAPLESALLQKNTLLQLGDRNIQLADIDLQLSKAAFKPTLQAYANFNYAYLQDDASFLQSTRSIGPNIGVRFSYPIYDGGARKIKQEVSQLTKSQREVERAEFALQLVKELRNAFAIYQNTLQQLGIEERNLSLFQTNLENTQNRFATGTATNTDVRNAQLNLSAAENRINNYRYTIKQAEVSLYLLSGQLYQ